MHPTPRPPRLLWVPLRVLVVTFLFTLMAFSISLLLGILITMTFAGLHHRPPNLTLIYRHIAPTVAAWVGTAVMIVAVVMEVRHYQQAKVLAAIERTS